MPRVEATGGHLCRGEGPGLLGDPITAGGAQAVGCECCGPVGDAWVTPSCLGVHRLVV